MTKVCPKCGVSSDKAKFIGEFCSKCYTKINRPTNLPLKIVVYKCRECGSEKYRRWNDEIEWSIAKSLSDKKIGTPNVKIEEDHIILSYKDLEEVYRIPLVIKESLCDLCAKKHSGYYEGIIQLRGRYAQDERFVNSLISKLERSTFIQRIEQLKEGIDIYYGDKEITRSILSSLKVKVKVSNKLWGVKNGRRIYRTTFLVRD